MKRANLLIPLALMAESAVFAFLAFQAPLKALPTESLSHFPQCLPHGSPVEDEQQVVLSCYHFFLQKWQFTFAPKLSVYLSLVEIAEGFAVASVVTLAYPALCTRVCARIHTRAHNEVWRLILGSCIAVGLGLFWFIVGANILMASVHWPLASPMFWLFGREPVPELVALFGLVTCGLGALVLAGFRKSILFMASLLAAAQGLLMAFNSSQMYLYFTTQLDQLQFNGGMVSNGANTQLPSGVSLLSNWFVLIVAVFFVYGSIETGESPGPVNVG